MLRKWGKTSGMKKIGKETRTNLKGKGGNSGQSHVKAGKRTGGEYTGGKDKGTTSGAITSQCNLNNNNRDNNVVYNNQNKEVENVSVVRNNRRPNQAAAEDSHIVVRGWAEGRSVERMVVNTNDTDAYNMGIMDLECMEHNGDPPDNMIKRYDENLQAGGVTTVDVCMAPAHLGEGSGV